MNAQLRRPMALIVGVIAALAICCGLMGSAHAGPLTAPADGTYLTYQYAGQQLYIGAIGTSERGHVYCIEAGKAAELTYSQEVALADTDQARRVAWLAEEYRESRDARIHAGIGVLAHRYFDLDANAWQAHWAAIHTQHPDLARTADELWNQAGQSMPASMHASYAYTEGLRSGTVNVGVLNSAGAMVAGVPYSVTLSGPAEFVGGGQRVQGTSADKTITHAWRATGEGEVSVSTTYQRPALQRLVSNQDYVRFAGNTDAPGSGVRFSVRKAFTPALGTVAEQHVVDAGQPVADTVTSGVAGATDHWVPGLELNATGWYFDRIDPEALDGAISPEQGQSAEAFLDDLASRGYKPAGYGEAVFDGPDQRATVQAHTADGKPYLAPAGGGFGTWVWAFERGRQSEQAREYMTRDVVTPFLEIPETNANRARVTVESTVTEHSATVGAELSDTITVSGFPDDHGSFDGDDAYGFGADNAYAQVRVWWAGDPDDPNNDEAYRPDTVEEPQEDDNHRLLGVWEYPAVNGTIRVGGGAPDAHGEAVHITAEQHGWYVFVYSFAGDDRVMPVTSAYNDGWERTRVNEYDTPERPVITTQVDPETVDVGDPFHDTARITGDIPEGSFVVFDAYEAVPEGQEPGGNGKLVHAHRVPVDHTLSEQVVSSPEVRSDEPGLVYWRAALISAEGDVLAAHELGAEGEVVTVKEPAKLVTPKERDPLPQAGSDLLAVFGVAVAALAVGAVMLASIRRRS